MIKRKIFDHRNLLVIGAYNFYSGHVDSNTVGYIYAKLMIGIKHQHFLSNIVTGAIINARYKNE